MKLSTGLGLLPLLAGITSAIDYDKRCEEQDVCLTSFIWCGLEFDSSECEWPEHMYPRDNNAKGAYTALIWSQEYELTWRVKSPDYTVKLRWDLGGGRNGDREVSQAWEKNFTNGETSYKFKFQDIAREMADNTTGFYAVKGMAGDLGNMIQLTQPELQRESQENGDSIWPAMDYSGQFIVIDTQAESFLEAQRAMGKDEMYDKWKLGVGVGVGVGVPLFLAAAFFAGCFLGKKRSSRKDVRTKVVESENHEEASTTA